MNVFSKAWAKVKGVFNRYEAAIQTYFGERSWLFQSYQDAKLDIDAATRTELQRKHRYWVCNSPMVQRIRNLHLQFTVGSCGLNPVPNSSNETWNELRAANWETNFAKSPDVSQLISFPQLTIQWSGALFDDGEIFVHKTVYIGKPALETIEAHRVATPRNRKDYQGRAIVDGVEIDENGRPVAYWVREFDQLSGKELDPSRIPASEMIHKFKVRRPGQLRGIPEGFAGLNLLHDYDDLHKLEMQAAKLASSIGNVRTNASGEIDMTATRRARMQHGSTNAAGVPVVKSNDLIYMVQMGAKEIAIKAGDSIKNFQIDRPSIATQNYWDTLHTLICCAYNVPKLLVMPYSLQGTVTRADLDVCAGAFRMSFEIILELVQEIYEWQTAWSVDYDRSMDGATPDDFLKCVIRPPRAPNVDIGYTAQALQVELQMGTKTVQDVFAERQQDWRTQTRQNFEYVAYLKKLGNEFGIDPKEVPQVTPAEAPAESETDQSDKAQTAQTAP